MEKFMKKMWKKSEGFTLVELIVVIAILGILAGVAVPAYSGYVNKANQTADLTTLDAVKTAAIAACAKDGAVTTLAVGEGAADAYTVTGTVGGTANVNIKAKADFTTFFTGGIELKTGSSAAWDGTTWTISE